MGLRAHQLRTKETGGLYFGSKGVAPKKIFIMCHAMAVIGFKSGFGRLIRAVASTILVAVVFLNTLAAISAHASPPADAATGVSEVQHETCTLRKAAQRMPHRHQQSNAREKPDEDGRASCSLAVCCVHEVNAAPILSVEHRLVSVQLVITNSAGMVSRSELPHDRPPRSV